MQVVVLVLNQIDLLDELLPRLKKAGINGGTIIESKGMISSLDHSNESYLLGSLRLFLDNPADDSRTCFFIVKDEQIDILKKTVYDVLGDLNKSNTGILFGLPLSFVDGLNVEI